MKKDASIFYKCAKFYTAEEMRELIRGAGFNEPEVYQTIFDSLENIKTVQPVMPGHGKGSYLLFKAFK